MAVPETLKQRDAPRTKAKILAAAQQAFAEQGYSHAGIRDIAAIAGVSSTLLLRYYGSKAGLFEAALIAAMPMDTLFAGGREDFGARLAAALARPDLDLKPPMMIALSTSDPEAREITARVSEEHSIAPLAQWLGPPDARARAIEIMTLCIGFAMCTRQIPLTAASRATDKKLVKWLAQSLQAIVDQG